MKIVDKKMLISNMSPGDVFEYSGNHYMVCDVDPNVNPQPKEGWIYAVWLGRSKFCTFTTDDSNIEATLVNAEIVLKDDEEDNNTSLVNDLAGWRPIDVGTLRLVNNGGIFYDWADNHLELNRLRYDHAGDPGIETVVVVRRGNDKAWWDGVEWVEGDPV